ncbi:DUF6090 family protein [Aquimarina brevivitae]|uniref:Uncharacterized protein n=1 Tax=Aquimarina brevivitae TaxID=323412 RepID=A0A4Q7P2G0_9FLAO|nr:DUF6090 family protein [Aquimarina brevivitae]RZS93955.1 hypothetical protein EV197_2536 [Aquimarina brevivitae]
MLRFNTKKKNDASATRTGFFSYAVREIILVVIGILIAVSINNCNEERKQNKELNYLLIRVQEDLKKDIAQIDTILTFYDKRKPYYKKVLTTGFTKKDYKKNRSLAFLIFGYPELTINQSGITAIENFKGEISHQKERLVQELISFYKRQVWEIKVDNDLRLEDFKENFNYWKTNENWWVDYVMLNVTDEFIDYAVNSKDYKNRVATSEFFTYKVYLPEIAKFKREGLKLIDKIEKVKQ